MSTRKPGLSGAIESLTARLDGLAAYLAGDTSPITRVANAPETTLEDATERARKYWDSLESKRKSIPPKVKP